MRMINLSEYRGVIITGANGWLGKSILFALQKYLESNPHNFQIRCSDFTLNEMTFPASIKPVWFVGDLIDQAENHGLFKNVDGFLLLHLAGSIHPKFFVKELFVKNVSTIKLLLRSSRLNGIKRLVAISSNSPFGVNDNSDTRFDEKSPYAPYMSYGKSKMLMEKEIFSIADQYPDFDFGIVRAPWFYGPFAPERQLRFFSMIKDGIFPVIAGGNNKRSMVSVEKLAEAILLLSSKKQIIRDHFWVADKNPYTMRSIITTIQDIMEFEFNISVNRRVLSLPSIFDPFITAVDYGIQSVGLYEQKIHVLSELGKNICCDVTKFENNFGFKAEKNLTKGVTNAINWHLNNDRNNKIFKI